MKRLLLFLIAFFLVCTPVLAGSLGGGGWDTSRYADIKSGTGAFTLLSTDKFITPYQQVVTVAKSGGDYKVIQEAIDSISDATSNKKYSVNIYPGVYTETIVMEGYVSLKGMGAQRCAVEITASSGTVLTADAGSTAIVRNIKIKATGTAEAINLPVSMGTNWIQFWNCAIESGYAAHADTLITQNSGHIQIINSTITYVATGGVTTHKILDVVAASAQIYIINSLIQADINDTGSNDFTAITLQSGANCNILVAHNAIEFDNEMTGGTSALYSDLDAETADRYIYGNHIHMKGVAGASGIVYLLGNVATTLNSTNPGIIVEGFNYNLLANVLSAATLNANFDDFTGDPEIHSGAGTINHIATYEPGKLHLDNLILNEKFEIAFNATSYIAGNEGTIIDAIVQTGGSSGGVVRVIDVADGGAGVAQPVAITTHDRVDVIQQLIGTAAAFDYAWYYKDTGGDAGPDTYVNATTFFSGATDTPLFESDNDVVFVGVTAAVPTEIEVDLGTFASQDLLFTFQYYNGSWTTFTPSGDDTRGFRQDGTIRLPDLSATSVQTAVNGQTHHWISITRTRNHIVTDPVEDTIKTTGGTLYEWDENGALTVQSIPSAGAIGGTTPAAGAFTTLGSTSYKTIYIPANQMTPTSTDGATAGTFEWPTNDKNVDYIAFAKASEEYVEFERPFPEEYNLGTIKAKFYWSSETGSTAGDTVEWEMGCIAQGDDDVIEAAITGQQVITDTLLTSAGADRQLTSATPAITIDGTPALHDMIHCKVSRNVGGGAGDDMAEESWLMGVLIQYQEVATVVSAW